MFVCAWRQWDRATLDVAATMAVAGGGISVGKARARNDVRTATREERRLFLLVMPAACFRTSEVNRSHVFPKHPTLVQRYLFESSRDYRCCSRAQTILETGDRDTSMMEWHCLVSKYEWPRAEAQEQRKRNVNTYGFRKMRWRSHKTLKIISSPVFNL